tara:strand:- start:19301 stop:19885 length:585 start_codon:yes stop_codon:yes gene_type:complete
MFTGIVQEKGVVKELHLAEQGIRIDLNTSSRFTSNIESGASVAVNGVCLTVTSFTNSSLSFDVIKETLRVTNLSDISEGSEVNLERSLKFGDELGGHILSGHVNCKCKAVIKKRDGQTELIVDISSELAKKITPKGYIALNGVSLTVGEVSDNCFSVFLIPETTKRTNLLSVLKGSELNLELEGGSHHELLKSI